MQEKVKNIFDKINNHRKNKGLVPLQIDPGLTQSTKMKSQEVKVKLYNEALPQNGSYKKFIREYASKNYTYLGELYATDRKLDNLIDNLLKNSGKSSYIFNPNYTHVGITTDSFDRDLKLVILHFGGK